METSVRVVKVGGSLFDRPDLGRRLNAWLAAEPPALNVFIAGGGELANVIRRADERHGLGNATSHDFCLRLLSITARWLAAVMDRPLEGTWEAIVRTSRAPGKDRTNRAVVFDPTEFLLHTEPRFTAPLPASWSVTSDSIAARIAALLNADECVLLKSADPPPKASLDELAAAGYVDGYFPIAVQAVNAVRFVNLAAATPDAIGKARPRKGGPPFRQLTHDMGPPEQDIVKAFSLAELEDE